MNDMNGGLLSHALKSAKKSLEEGNHCAAFSALKAGLRPTADFGEHHKAVRIFESLDKDALGLKPLRLAVLSTCTVDHLAPVLRLYLAREGWDADIFIGGYDTLHQTVLDPMSALYAFKPDIVWLFTGHRDAVIETGPGDGEETVAAAVSEAVGEVADLWRALSENAAVHVIQNNADLPLERALGNFDATAPWGRPGALRRYNLELARAAGPGVSVFDLDFISSLYGKEIWFDERYWYHSKHAFALDATGRVCHQAAKLIRAVKGEAKKCLVLDLDNTLWGGVIGDDGMAGIRLGKDTVEGEAFEDFQRYLLSLKERGIILGICSKNDKETAMQPFLEHPAMVLKLDDIAVFVANWDNKADNIRQIAETLDIGLESLVFVDDNPVERGLIRSMLPEVTVPEMPIDPSLFIRALDGECNAEMVSFSDEDKGRGAMYRANAKRKSSRKHFTDVSDFLKSLEMTATAGDIDASNLPRCTQLINKTNQFNLTTIRYSEAQVRDFMEDEETICRFFKLRDSHGDNGLISLVVLREEGEGDLYVDTWVMSCRVLSRSMEEFVYNHILGLAREKGRRRLVGRYRPSGKNALVSNLYRRLGFDLVEDRDGETLWTQEVKPDMPFKETFIEDAAP